LNEATNGKESIHSPPIGAVEFHVTVGSSDLNDFPQYFFARHGFVERRTLVTFQKKEFPSIPYHSAYDKVSPHSLRCAEDSHVTHADPSVSMLNRQKITIPKYRRHAIPRDAADGLLLSLAPNLEHTEKMVIRYHGCC